MKSKYFLITGCSTGIGEACALHFAKKGHRVFAGVRKKGDGQALEKKAGANLTPLILDVTSQKSITDSFKLVSDFNPEGLDGLVNNAGIVVAGPQEFIPIEAFRRQLEVNVTGPMAVTQAFLPLLRKRRGRILNMGSLSGLTAIPFVGPYAASKFALRGLTDALRLELHPWGIRVVLIEPGPIATPIWEKSKTLAFEMVENVPEAERYYGKVLKDFVKGMERTVRMAVSPQTVVDVVEDALLSKNPKIYYPVGRAAKLQAALAHLVPQTLMDKIIMTGMGLSHLN